MNFFEIFTKHIKDIVIVTLLLINSCLMVLIVAFVGEAEQKNRELNLRVEKLLSSSHLNLKQNPVVIPYEGWISNDPLTDQIVITLFVVGGLCLAGFFVYYLVSMKEFPGSDKKGGGGFGPDEGGAAKPYSGDESVLLDKSEFYGDVLDSLVDVKETLEELVPKINNLGKTQLNHLEFTQILTAKVSNIDSSFLDKVSFDNFVKNFAGNALSFNKYVEHSFATLNTDMANIIKKNILIKIKLDELAKNIASEPPVPSIFEANDFICNIYNFLIDHQIIIFTVLSLILILLSYSFSILFFKKYKLFRP